jgi:hypothetical protein
VHPNPAVENRILDALGQLETEFTIVIPSGQKSKVVHGCLTAMTAIQDVIRPKLVQQGFKACSQYPLDFDKLMRQCYSDIKPAELEHMARSTEDDVNYFGA